MPIIHIVARAHSGLNPLRDPDTARWLFGRLRETWPNALAACVMPDHPHLLAEDDPDEARFKLGRILSGCARRRGRRKPTWQPVPTPKVVPDHKHLERTARYLHLNPCRKELASDPLAWPWSTHRGVVGAEHDPWVDADRLAEALGRSPLGFARWFHGYVSADSSVDPRGSFFPVAAEPREVVAVPLETIVRAATVATVWSSAAERRATICALARHQGWRDASAVSVAAGVTRQHVRLLWRNPPPRALAAALLCLGDERLLR